MKKVLSVILCFMALGLCGCSNSNANNIPANTDPIEIDEETKVLITYFSRADENYNVGYIDKGNTEYIADYIAKYVDVDLTFKVERVTPYPSKYSDCTKEAQDEKNANARPDIIGSIDDFSSYDIVFFGYPIWWGDLPMPVYTFIESYDWDGKIVIPFSTHEGSGWSGTINTLKNKMAGASFKDGFNTRGSNAKNSEAEVKSWLDGLNLNEA